MDRIDLHVQVPPVQVKKLTVDKKAQTYLEKSIKVRKRVAAARKIQSNRFKDLPIHTNSEMRNKQLRKFCRLDTESDRLLKQAIDQFQLSARAYFRLVKIARTIADLAGEEDITSQHIAEALQYRVKG